MPWKYIQRAESLTHTHTHTHTLTHLKPYLSFPSPHVQECVTLFPYRAHARQSINFTVGAVIPSGPSLARPEIWTCPRNGRHFQVLDADTFDITAEVPFPDNEKRDGRCVTRMTCFEHGEQSFLAVADRWFVQWWDVAERKQVGEFSCHDACRELYSAEQLTNCKFFRRRGLLAESCDH